MKKRLFCLLVAIAMLSSSIAAYATEPEKRATTEGEGSEKGVDELEEDGIRETEKTPDVIPETNEEADQVPEETKTPDVEVEATASPDTVPTVEPEEEAGAEPTEMPVVIPSEKPETVPEVEQTVSPSPTLLPQESALPEADAVVDATPSPSMSPTPSASPTASPVALVPEDEFVGATGDLIIDQTITLTENRVVNGNLIVNSRLNLGNYKIEVSGDVIANGAIFVDTGILVVHGNYRQEKNGLNVKSGRVDIQKDLRIQTKNAEGNYAPSSGYLDMDEAGGRLNIDGDFIMQTSNSNNWCGRGTMTLKGNFIQMSTGGNNDYFDGYASYGFKLIMAGNGQQKISLASRGSELGNIQFDNQDIILEGAFSGKLLTSINPKAIGDTITTYNLDLNGKNMTLPASLSAVGTGVQLNGGTLIVQGNLEASGKVLAEESGSHLVVYGEYRQEKERLSVGNGRVDIGRNLRIQSKDAEGNYVSGSAWLNMDEAGGRLNIDGDFIMQTSNSNNWCGRGTMTLKGNFIQMSVGGNDYFDGYAPNGFKLIMAGSSPQKISLASRGSKLGNIQLDNQNIIVEGYMNATLVSDGAIKAADSGRIDVTELKLNNHQLEVLGNVVASGDVEMGGTNGYLKVTGNYVQASGRLRIGSGRMDVTGDLRMQAQDANGNYDVGSGYLEMSEDSGRLNVDGNIVIQSAKNTNLYRGTITLLGNMTQSSSNGAVGYIYSNETHRVILANANSQSLLFDNRSSKVGTLQLTRNKSSYRFGFEPCWIKLISWPFSDVTISEGNWKYESVKYVYDNNIMNGINGTTRFDPDEPLTRAMFATVLYRMAGNPPVQFQNKFEDVVDGRYYSRAVIWAYNQGIVNGVEGGIRYGIDEYITREQIAKMLKEYGRVRNYTMNESANLNSFPDRSEISGWAAGYMQWAVGSGMVTGKNINGIYYLDPKGNATRAECAAMLTRFMQRY